MRADLERAIVRRRAQGCSDPVQKARLLRQVAEMAETSNDYPAFGAALKEYQEHVTANPGCEPAAEIEQGAA